ncbi:hypothetical protein OS493_032245 [Desmophyllum pertusum]|uniref:Uncharacterized protein n=1 Tax=Desmophyllum pertusum TaxID=174260 RepID=A0A9X0D106_9CNID|nr:hypothetical protein OS493_032245 [Desmophyllum pertusum]
MFITGNGTGGESIYGGTLNERLKFESNNDIGRNTRNLRRRGKQNNSGSDSEGQEENGNILRSNREEEEKEESAISEARLHLNSAARNSRSGTREYEEDDNTGGMQVCD